MGRHKCTLLIFPTLKTFKILNSKLFKNRQKGADSTECCILRGILSFVLNYAALEHDSIISGKTRECWTQRISENRNMNKFCIFNIC